MLNKQKGNMYGFVTHTWNTIKGKCPHDCKYCYMKRFPQKQIRFDEKELKTNLGENNFIFVGSSCDMWAEAIPKKWIDETINHCKNHVNNKYLFQSKNPQRFIGYQFPENSILATTIESNRDYIYHRASTIMYRSMAMSQLKRSGRELMITIEPIMMFDLKYLVEIIKNISPMQINIGADSRGCNLPEPTGDEINALIHELHVNGFEDKIYIKTNLKRLFK